MQISKVTVENFRAIDKATMSFEPCTIIIGDNNSGKSTFLQAIEVFFDGSAKRELDDFHNRRIEQPIRITIEFSRLTPDEFSKYESKLIDETLTVTRTFHASNDSTSGLYSVTMKCNPDFARARSSELSATERRKEYSMLHEKYSDLPKISKADDIEPALDTWETQNEEKLSIDTVSGFWGAKNVASGKIKDKTEYIFVQAAEKVHDEINEKKSSPIIAILNTIARQSIENNERYVEFKKRVNEEVEELTSPNNIPEIKEISSDLTDLIKKYYSDTKMFATWDEIREVNFNLPTSKVQLENYGFLATIDRVGHGLQRAALFTVLEYTARRRALSESSESYDFAQSDIILAIEEPELYQHPIKQRLFKEVLSELTESFSKSTGIRFQVLYVTHSPLLISIQDCQRIRAVRRHTDSEITVDSTTLKSCSEEVAKCKGLPPDRAYSPEQYGVTLHIFTPEISEGFFARAVVLVEGVTDKAILEAYYLFIHKRTCLTDGIAICCVGGKTNLDKPLTIFQNFNIPTYTIFDSDEGKQGGREYNQLLQKLCREECIKDFPDRITEKYAAWAGDIESYLISEATADVYNIARDTVSKPYDISSKYCSKSPVVASALIQKLHQQGIKFSKLDDVFKKIDQLKK